MEPCASEAYSKTVHKKEPKWSQNGAKMEPIKGANGAIGAIGANGAIIGVKLRWGFGSSTKGR